jgi:hypothetical protein
MTESSFPITPPPELLDHWANDYWGEGNDGIANGEREIATQAARWGADQELEACCEWLHWQNLATHKDLIPSLRLARRPKPPSLKEQALDVLDKKLMRSVDPEGYDTIRRALEQLND